MAQTREVISCFGQFGCVDNFHEFNLRIDVDGTLSACMERTSRRRWLAQANGGEHEDPGEEEELDGPDEPRCGLLNGQATQDAASGEYEVHFIIGTWWPMLFRGAGMACSGRLSARGLTGTFRYLKPQIGTGKWFGDDEAIDGLLEEQEHQFTLEVGQDAFAVERLYESFVPLTSGEFRLDGFALTNTLALVSCHVTMDLLPDHTLRGDLLQYVNFAPIPVLNLQGTWTTDRISWITTSARNERPQYSFVGAASVAGLRGTWSTPQIHPLNYRFESASFDLKLFSTNGRAWSEALHPFFPDDFRESLRLLLLFSLRGSKNLEDIVLSNDLWRHVFAYMSERWFWGEQHK